MAISFAVPENLRFDILEGVLRRMESLAVRTNKDTCASLVGWLFVTNRVLAEIQVVVVAANDDGGICISFPAAVVQNDVLIEAIAMGAQFGGFVAKLDAVPGIGDDAISGEGIVRAAAADGDPRTGVLQELVILEAAILDGNTHEEPAVSIASSNVATDEAVVRVASRMNAHAHVVLDRTIFDRHVL